MSDVLEQSFSIPLSRFCLLVKMGRGSSRSIMVLMLYVFVSGGSFLCVRCWRCRVFLHFIDFIDNVMLPLELEINPR